MGGLLEWRVVAHGGLGVGRAVGFGSARGRRFFQARGRGGLGRGRTFGVARGVALFYRGCRWRVDGSVWGVGSALRCVVGWWVSLFFSCK